MPGPLQISVKLSGVDDTAKLLAAVRREQVPFVVSKTVNDVAKAFQKSQRANMRQHFTERRAQWVNQNVKVTHFSDKHDTDIYASVAIEAPGDAMRSDILAKFEDGGEKTPHGAGAALGGLPAALGVPIKARPGKRQVVPQELRIKNLGITQHVTHTGATQFKGANGVFVLMSKRTGQPLIFQRTAHGGRELKRRRATGFGTAGGVRLFSYGRSMQGPGALKLLWALRRNVPIGKLLGFYGTATITVNTSFQSIANANLDRALASARK